MSTQELITLAVVATVVVVILSIGRLDRKRRARTGAVLSGTLGTFDEVFHPEAARAMEIREVEQELPAPAPVPGDPVEQGKPYILKLSGPES